jgi:hypothetical protein
MGNMLKVAVKSFHQTEDVRDDKLLYMFLYNYFFIIYSFFFWTASAEHIDF